MKRLEMKLTKDYITDNIKQEILEGRIEDGQELVQEDLAKAMGISRIPIREALQSLENTGLAKRLPNRHVVAIAPTIRSVRATFRMLACIEYELILLLLVEKGSESISTIFSRFLRNSTVDNEINLHRFLSEELDICPLTNTHRNLIDGYFTYALKHCTRDILSVKSSVTELSRCINEHDSVGIKAGLEIYFHMLADAMIKDGQYD